MSGKAKGKEAKTAEERPREYSTIESPDLPDSPMTVDMAPDALADFFKQGVDERGTWSVERSDGSRTVINVSAVSWVTISPVTGDTPAEDVRHLDPER